MPKFLVLMKATESASTRALMSGSAGVKHQRFVLEKYLHGHLLFQYSLVGGYDQAIVIDLPDHVSALAISRAAAVGGMSTTVLPAIVEEELEAATQLVVDAQRQFAEDLKKMKRSSPASRAAKKVTE